MDKAVPTLSSDGFATDIRVKADALIAYYFASDFSQSNLFRENIVSLAYQVQQFGSSPNELKRVITASMEGYLGRHFDSASVSVQINESDASAQYEIVFDAVVTQDDLKYSVGKLVEIQNNRVVRIIDKLQKGF